MARKYTCPKCSGTGVVQRFGHVKNGICFDCDGTGQISVAPSGGRVIAPRVAARTVGDAVLAGQEVDEADAVSAFEYFEDAGPLTWLGKDCDRRNALGRRIGRIF